MALGFNRDLLKDKLRALSSSQQSIQTISLLLRHHRSHAEAVVDVWLEELHAAPKSRKLPLLYLANDAILQSRKSGPEIKEAFKDSLAEALTHVYSIADSKTKSSIGRMIDIWEERGAYEKVFVDSLRLACKKPKEIEVALVGDFDADQHSHAHPVNLAEVVALLDATEAASAQWGVHQRKIADVDPMLLDPSSLASFENISQLDTLQTRINEAEKNFQICESSIEDVVKQRTSCLNKLESAIAQQQAELSICQNHLASSKDKLSKATKAKRELRLHLSNMPKPLEVTASLDSLPEDVDFDLS